MFGYHISQKKCTKNYFKKKLVLRVGWGWERRGEEGGDFDHNLGTARTLSQTLL